MFEFLKLKKIKVDIKNINEGSSDNNNSLELSIEYLKEKNKELIKTEKNSDYERSLFLYEIGFLKLKRVRDFIKTMDTIGNIESFLAVENRYSKFKLEILNYEMLQIIKKDFNFKEDSNDKFDGFIPNSAIDKLKKEYLVLEKSGLMFNLYKKYYEHRSPELVTKEDIRDINYFITNNYDKLKLTLNDENKSMYSNNYYYSIKKKPLIVCHNNNKGMILLEIESNHYMILSEWDGNDGETLEKMNFKDFIKNQNK